MAEAAVVEPMPTRFYCHVCNVEINIPNTDFTCPLCAGGFVEELPANTPPTSASSSGSSILDDDHTNPPNLFRLAGLRDDIATFLMSRNGPNVEILAADPENRENLFTLGGGSNIAGGPAGGRVRPQNLDRLDTVLLDFLQSLSAGEVPMGGGPGNPQMFWMGNLGDYAWGREGIDTIVTQLLNQMETSGPPPLAKDKIEEIPKVEITSEEVDKKMQCSVCWEDFKLKELVRKLPCSHIYHENCIVPWLDLHGTCPICRKSLTGEEAAGSSMEVNDLNSGSGTRTNPSTGHIHCPLHSSRSSGAVGTATANSSVNGSGSVSGGVGGSSSTNPNPATTNNVNSAGAGSSSATSQSQTRNNVFTFDDRNMDLD